jgi:hypothetical protein
MLLDYLTGALEDGRSTSMHRDESKQHQREESSTGRKVERSDSGTSLQRTVPLFRSRLGLSVSLTLMRRKEPCVGRRARHPWWENHRQRGQSEHP